MKPKNKSEKKPKASKKTELKAVAQLKTAKPRTIPENPIKVSEGTTAQEVLKLVFGYDNFRPGQEDAINSIIAGNDTLVIMSTGGGKSLIFQIPALLADGLTIVVTPLIALMQDQVEALARKNIRAAIINSMLSTEEYAAEIKAIENGDAKILYIAPERLQNEGFISYLKSKKISYFVGEEIHCASSYGHDFRPDYMKLGGAREKLGMPQVIAVTATATPRVRKDVVDCLKLKEYKEFCFGFERPNLTYNINEILAKGSDTVAELKIDRIKEVINKFKTGIIYCSTKKAVDSVYFELKSKYKIERYHAGMEDDERNTVLEKFISKEADIVVATNAFGMGIDRPDVRFVVHYSFPGSVEAYSQEIGRAGRDGKEGYCEMLYSHGDLFTQRFFVEGKNPKPKMIEDVFHFIRGEVDFDNEVKMSQTDFVEAYKTSGDNPMAIEASVNILAKCGAIEKFDLDARKKGIRLITKAKTIGELKIDWAVLAEKSANDNKRLDEMVRLAKSPNCAQSNVLKYFEVPGKPCGKCAKCLNKKIGDFTK